MLLLPVFSIQLARDLTTGSTQLVCRPVAESLRDYEAKVHLFSLYSTLNVIYPEACPIGFAVSHGELSLRGDKTPVFALCSVKSSIDVLYLHHAHCDPRSLMFSIACALFDVKCRRCLLYFLVVMPIRQHNTSLR